jgi:Cu-processing system permease protein
MVLTSHILAEIQERVDRLAIMAAGKVQATGTSGPARADGLPLWFDIDCAAGDPAGAARGPGAACRSRRIEAGGSGCACNVRASTRWRCCKRMAGWGRVRDSRCANRRSKTCSSASGMSIHGIATSPDRRPSPARNSGTASATAGCWPSRWCSPCSRWSSPTFGGAQQGMVGFRSIEFTIASLVSLVIYLIPLIALVLGFDAIVGERERGSLDLLLSMPITRFELLLGKYLGLAGALAFSTVAGFGLVAVVLRQQLDLNGLFHYGGFMASSVLLGLRLPEPGRDAVGVRQRPHARLGAGHRHLVLLRAGVRFAAAGRAGGHRRPLRRRLFPYLLLLNPADVFRVLNIFSLEDVRTLYGLASVVPTSLGSPAIMGGVMLLWIAVPLILANWRFKP